MCENHSVPIRGKQGELCLLCLQQRRTQAQEHNHTLTHTQASVWFEYEVEGATLIFQNCILEV